jgi:hypothetical protein
MMNKGAQRAKPPLVIGLMTPNCRDGCVTERPSADAEFIKETGDLVSRDLSPKK